MPEPESGRRPRSGNTRRQLLLAARQCLQERGYANTTARDVAREAGVSLGNIPYHFDSVDALLTEALAESAREWIDHFAASGGARSASSSEDFGEAISEFYMLMKRERPLLVAFVEALARSSHAPSLKKQLALHYQEFRESTRAQIESSLGPGLERSGLNPSVFASLLVALSDGLIVQFLIDPKRMPTATEITDLLRTMGL